MAPDFVSFNHRSSSGGHCPLHLRAETAYGPQPAGGGSQTQMSLILGAMFRACFLDPQPPTRGPLCLLVKVLTGLLTIFQSNS